jgi:thioredoxin-related protein
MKKTILSSVICLIAIALISFRTSLNVLPIGSSLPMADVKMKNIKGDMVSIKDAMKKNGVLVMFSCNTCPFVIKNQARTKEICQYALQNKLGVIVINSNEGQRSEDDSYDAMKKYAAEQGYSWYYVVDKDNAIADAFGANRTPECFLFNKDAKLFYHGAIDDNPTEPQNVKRQHLKEAINELIAGKDITVKESRSVGCSIKRKA